MEKGYFEGLGPEPSAAGGQWESGGLGAKPPAAVGTGVWGGAPSAKKFCIFCKNNNFRAILVKNRLLKRGIEISSATCFNWLH